MTSVPAAISAAPIRLFMLNCSCRNTHARISVMTTLSLSMGTTLLA